MRIQVSLEILISIFISMFIALTISLILANAARAYRQEINAENASLVHVNGEIGNLGQACGCFFGRVV